MKGADQNGHNESDRFVVHSDPSLLGRSPGFLGHRPMSAWADRIIVGAFVLFVGWLIHVIRKVEKEQ